MTEIDSDNHQWLIFTTPSCSWCVKAKELLAAEGFSYDEVDATQQGSRDLFRECGFKTVPQVFHKGFHVGGYQSLVNYLGDIDNDNKIHPLNAPVFPVDPSGSAGGVPVRGYVDV